MSSSRFRLKDVPALKIADGALAEADVPQISPLTIDNFYYPNLRDTIIDG